MSGTGFISYSIFSFLLVMALSGCGGSGGGVANTAPSATRVSITDANGGDAIEGDSLTGNYTYADADGDVEGASSYRWLRDGVAISGATSSNYTLVAADSETSITFEVTPVAATGETMGTAVISSAVAVPKSFTLFNMEVAETGGNFIFNLTGSDTNTDNFTGSFSIADQGQVVSPISSLMSVQTDLTLTLSVNAGGPTATVITVYSDPVTAAVQDFVSPAATCSASTPNNLPIRAAIGNFGSLGSRVCDDGTTEAATWLLEGAGGGNARLTFLFVKTNTSSGAYLSDEEDSYIIDASGAVISLQLIFTDSGGYVRTLDGTP